jgi:hypothetical protein
MPRLNLQRVSRTRLEMRYLGDILAAILEQDSRVLFGTTRTPYQHQD